MKFRGVTLTGSLESPPRPWTWTSPAGVTSKGSRVQLAAGGCFWTVELGGLSASLRDALHEDDTVTFRVNRVRPGRNGVILADATDVLEHEPEAQ